MAKILLVEDNEMNRDLISRKLKRRGYEILLAVDGAEGIERATDESPDLVLMDMGLPIIDGYAATRLLKGNDATCGIPVIGLSAHAMTGDAEKALEAGCDDYDTKPIEWERLLGKIRQALEKAHQTSAVTVPQDSATTVIDAESSGVMRTGLVLIVDDNPMHREVLSGRVGELGFSSEVAANALQALELLGEKRFDAVLIDVTLPSQGCQQLLEKLQDDPRREDMPLLILCPIDAVDDAIGCLRLGADDFIPQPFHSEVIEARLVSSLERRQLRRKRKDYERVADGDERHSEHLLRVLLPAPLVEELKATQKILPRRHPDVAVLVAKVVDFDVLCDASEALEAIGHLQELVGAFEEIVERHRLTKLKTVGGTFVAAAGIFQPVDDPVGLAVGCAFELRETAGRLRPTWNVRLGVHVGPVVAGVVGRRRYQFDVWGETVAIARRVGQNGGLNAVNLSAAAWKRVSSSYQGHEVGQVDRGDEPLAVVRVAQP